MKPIKSAKSTKPVAPAQMLSVDQLRAIVGGAAVNERPSK